MLARCAGLDDLYLPGTWRAQAILQRGYRVSTFDLVELKRWDIKRKKQVATPSDVATPAAIAARQKRRSKGRGDARLVSIIGRRDLAGAYDPQHARKEDIVDSLYANAATAKIIADTGVTREQLLERPLLQLLAWRGIAAQEEHKAKLRASK